MLIETFNQEKDLVDDCETSNFAKVRFQLYSAVLTGAVPSLIIVITLIMLMDTMGRNTPHHIVYLDVFKSSLLTNTTWTKQLLQNDDPIVLLYYDTFVIIFHHFNVTFNLISPKVTILPGFGSPLLSTGC